MFLHRLRPEVFKHGFPTVGSLLCLIGYQLSMSASAFYVTSARQGVLLFAEVAQELIPPVFVSLPQVLPRHGLSLLALPWGLALIAL